MPSPKRIGRPILTDQMADQRLCEQWKAARSGGMSRADFATLKGLTLAELERAIDRHRTRARNNNDLKAPRVA